MAIPDLLDEAYQQLHTKGPEFEGWLSNHGPMAADALMRERVEVLEAEVAQLRSDLAVAERGAQEADQAHTEAIEALRAEQHTTQTDALRAELTATLDEARAETADATRAAHAEALDRLRAEQVAAMEAARRETTERLGAHPRRQARHAASPAPRSRPGPSRSQSPRRR